MNEFQMDIFKRLVCQWETRVYLDITEFERKIALQNEPHQFYRWDICCVCIKTILPWMTTIVDLLPWRALKNALRLFSRFCCSHRAVAFTSLKYELRASPILSLCFIIVMSPALNNSEESRTTAISILNRSERILVSMFLSCQKSHTAFEALEKI